MEKKYEITEKLLNAILQYLSNKPFAEVTGLIQGIQTEATAQNKKEIIKPEEEVKNETKGKKDRKDNNKPGTVD